MEKKITVKVPDIGDFSAVPVIEILVKPGDEIKKEEPLVVLESDKASMEVPSPEAGKVQEILVKNDDALSEGDAILVLTITDSENKSSNFPEIVSSTSPLNTKMSNSSDLQVDLVVLGSGPGGYTAAFRAADLGQKVALVEKYSALGGVCLNVGCIPSKALLHAARVIAEADELSAHGINFGKPKIEIDKLRNWKEKTVSRLTSGLTTLAKKRNLSVITGTGMFSSKNSMLVKSPTGDQKISFKHAIIAAGSRPTRLTGLPYQDSRIMDSTSALNIQDIPKHLLIIGGGVIGLEMATVYHGLGSKVTIAELSDGIIPEADKDLVAPLHKTIQDRYESILLNTRVDTVVATGKGLDATLSSKDEKVTKTFSKILVSVGRQPNGNKIGAERAGVNVEPSGFIPVDNQMRTNVSNIFAIGDIVGQPMLAHKASHEGKLCAEIISGQSKLKFDSMGIPSVAYTDPEVAWVGVTEKMAQKGNISIKKALFPWMASGRAQTSGRSEGLTKLLFSKTTGKLIGAGITGIHAGELIAEAILGIEMGADSEDIALTIHPHPTLSETILFSAEIAEKSITDLYLE